MRIVIFTLLSLLFCSGTLYAQSAAIKKMRGQAPALRTEIEQKK